MKKNIIILMMSLCFMATYNVGDKMGTSHQNQEFELCYGASSDGTVKFSDFNGNTNGGDYHVMVVDMSATWCGPCQSLIPLFDELQQEYINNQYVKFFVALSDLNQPYSCTQWGNMGESGIPYIIDDTGYPIYNMFESGGFPSLVLIDHNMEVYYKEAGYYPTFVEDISSLLDDMLYDMENSLILYPEINQNLQSDDGDGILNPGEEVELVFVVENNSFYLDALSVQGILENTEDIIFQNNTINFNDIEVDNQITASVVATINSDAVIQDNDFILTLRSDYIDLDGNYNQYEDEFPFNINISLSQAGFPYDTNSEVKPSPVIIDFDNDGSNEIIFGDNSGLIHVLNSDGTELENNVFPYDTGNQIWGATASGDIDNDGLIDIVILSKSKHLYVFDMNGLKLDYNANQYLMGTPALGNLDDDIELEIVFGSFSSSAKLFAVNIDGTDVDGFPISLGEKTQKGVALADFNSNGKDDIVIGTDSDNIYLIYDDASIASGFPFQTGDKVRCAPSILDIDGEKIILAGSKDNNFYAINSDGTLKFLFISDDDIYTSPSFLSTDQGVYIFFASDSGSIYALDLNGNLKDGFPLISDSISESIIFEDLDSDGIAEMIFGDELGKMNVLKSIDSNYSSFITYDSFPISNTFAFTSSMSVSDIDNDGDIEIYGGTSGDLVVVDIKDNATISDDFWNIYRGNYLRNGLFITELNCSPGDYNGDSVLNILDIVSLVNIVIENSSLSDSQLCAADMNADGIINILDIVALVNIIIQN